MLLEALPTDIDLIVRPELWAVAFNPFDSYAPEGEVLDGPSAGVCAEIARTRSTWVLAGSIVEQHRAGLLRNTAVLLDRAGRVAMTASKAHVFGYASREVELLAPGDAVSTVAAPFGRVGSTTSYDLRFPGLWNELVDAGAELMIVPAAWPAARLGHWRLLTSARAVDTQTFVIASNSCGSQNGVALGGHSRVVDPWGERVDEADVDEEVLIVDIDSRRVGETRDEFPVLDDRLADYRVLRGTEVIA